MELTPEEQEVDGMKAYSIIGWQATEPHWHEAVVRATSAKGAGDIFEAWLKDHAEDQDTIGEVLPRDLWVISERKGAILSVIGNWCR